MTYRSIIETLAAIAVARSCKLETEAEDPSSLDVLDARSIRQAAHLLGLLQGMLILELDPAERAEVEAWLAQQDRPRVIRQDPPGPVPRKDPPWSHPEL